MKTVFLGLDLAWVATNPSGAAALDGEGRVIDVRSDLGGDAAVLAWVRRHLDGAVRGAIAIDMPTIVVRETGRRACERVLSGDFRAHHAGAYPANRGLPAFRDGGRAHHLLAALAADGVVHACQIASRDERLVAFEAFPHAAAVRLFGLDRVLPYKKKRRPWPDVLAAWARYRALLETLAGADPPLHVGDALPDTVDARRYKRWDDAIDGVFCAYIASWVWRWGTVAPYVRVYGDMADGHIVVPDRQAIEGSPFAAHAAGERQSGIT